ncbi:MAG: 30S ribosomal protein S16 [Myxococcota bacterium]|nr:30S ribosomal protein S16 [Myxococcota bacterium]
MAVTIRLARRGQTHRPFYHIVAADQRFSRDGRYLEKIGTYNPMGPTELKIDEEKAKKWLGVGATQSPTVKKLLRRAGVA